MIGEIKYSVNNKFRTTVLKKLCESFFRWNAFLFVLHSMTWHRTGSLLYRLIRCPLMASYDLQQKVALNISLSCIVSDVHSDPHQLLECLQPSVPVGLRWRRAYVIIVLSAPFFFFLYSKHHCDPKLEDKRTHFSWFKTLWGKPKPAFICSCVLGHGFVYSSVFPKCCWQVK